MSGKSNKEKKINRVNVNNFFFFLLTKQYYTIGSKKTRDGTKSQIQAGLCTPALIKTFCLFRFADGGRWRRRYEAMLGPHVLLRSHRTLRFNDGLRLAGGTTFQNAGRRHRGRRTGAGPEKQGRLSQGTLAHNRLVKLKISKIFSLFLSFFLSFFKLHFRPSLGCHQRKKVRGRRVFQIDIRLPPFYIFPLNGVWKGLVKLRERGEEKKKFKNRKTRSLWDDKM